MEPVPIRLKSLRNRTSPKLASRKVAEMLGVPASTYAAYEDINKFKKPVLPFELTKKLAVIFESAGILQSETMELAGITGEFTNAMTQFTEKPAEQWVTVTGSVAAGVWREQSDWPGSEQYDVEFGPPPFRGAERFAVHMEGRSMDLTVPPGSDLECLRIAFSPVPPAAGDLVIVARSAHDLTEMTCKRLDIENGDWILRCESSQPEFQEAIHIGRPDGDYVGDEGVRVVGIVLSAKINLAPPGLGTRRYLR